MSGVIGEDGVQWERANCCGKWVRVERLVYEAPTPQYPFGRDLCAKRCPNEAATKELVKRLKG